ncbi:rhomboid family intramembrane serine protease [Desulfosarcina widdelii]|uniref:Rhomboid family intramembrane serine protease n=1 Tax=Desulfosarcina widdelii TaxID=947919 RepID=A0A5K7YY74_9BACT|nr:rhomboid family intramembrane serine protease [Desulfosarcina widdelii]BBO72863.1 rhomboid family intramembrane serine protease [Desulfosarcina widdelii]
MNNPASSKGPLLCPRCRKLVSADESRCPYCGLTAPGSRWRHGLGTSLLMDGNRLIRAILVVNVVFYLLTLMLSGRGMHLSANPLAFLAPSSRGLMALGATGTIPIDGYHRWWTLIAASYLHGGLLHILFNMLAFRQLAPFIVQTYGTHRMLAIYTLTGAAGFLLSYLAGVRFTIGASAAICGLIGAALYYGKSRGGLYGQAVYRQVGGWALFIILFGFIVPGINNWAHGGGMVTGILLGLALGYRERKRETAVHRWLGILCFFSTLFVLVWAVFSALVLR